MKIKLIAVGILVIGSLGCSAQNDAQAQERDGQRGKRDPQEVFTKFDANKDGQLEKSEVKGKLAKRFTQIDADNNGYITMAELEAAPRPQRGKGNKGNGEGRNGERPDPKEVFAKLDTNEDGQLAKSEVKGRMQNHFDEIDTDNNGFITLQELEAAPKPQRGQGNRGGGQGPPQQEN